MSREARILIAGSRDWGQWNAVAQVVRALSTGAEVAHGDARGADTMFHFLLTKGRSKDVRRAGRVSVHSEHSTKVQQRQGGRGDIDIHVFPAEWDRHRPSDDSGRKNPAGPIRNRYMLRHFRPTAVVFFHDHLDAGGGTADMIEIASAEDVPVFEWRDYAAMRRGED